MNRLSVSTRAASFRSLLALSLCLALAVSLGSGCSKTIGDECKTNVECSPQGDRFCEIASPGGYCTVEGCDATSCPDDAVCVRFFSLKRGDAACTTGLVARADCPAPQVRTAADGCCRPGEAACCQLGERCLCDDEGCQKSFCASETTERRWCMKGCEGDDDCRAGYSCRPTDSGGAIAVATRVDGGVELARKNYCTPSLH